MSHAISLGPLRSKADATSVTAIARETETSVDLVKALYEEEIATLSAQAKVKTFVGVIATKNVRRQLRELAGAD